MATSHLSATGPALNSHELIGRKAEGLTSSAASLQALEDAERSLADLQHFLTDIRRTTLSGSSSALFCFQNPHLQARRELRARQKRNTLFGGALFSDPAWDILLLLFSAHPEHESVVVKEFALSAGVPLTTTLRWISTLEDKGVVWRRQNEVDRRAINVGLTQRGLELMRSYFAD